MEGSTGIVLILVPGGAFTMGLLADSPHLQSNRADQPAHARSVRPFLISRCEMTQGQWLHLTGEHVADYGPGWQMPGYEHDLRHPVESISWLRTDEVLRRYELTTPTEAQWEYAARAGTTTPWWCGARESSIGSFGCPVPVMPVPSRPSKRRMSCRMRSEPSVTTPFTISPVLGSDTDPPVLHPRVDRCTQLITL